MTSRWTRLSYNSSMITLFAGLLVLTVSSAETAPPSRCGLLNLSVCPNTNVLVWDPTFKRAMKAFAGQPRTDFLRIGRKRALADELIAVLGGPPNEPRRLADGTYVFTACRAHDCPQKGAVLLSPKGDILAAAMFIEGLVDKDNQPSASLSLEIFVRNARLQQPWRKAIDEWAGEAAEERRQVMQQQGWGMEAMSRRIWRITPLHGLHRIEQ